MGKLTALAVKAALANPGTYQDGEGLFLKVGKRGGASWALRLQRDGKRQDIGLGSAKLLSLTEPYHVHGFRSTFTDWAANEGIPDAVVEAALAHKTPDAVQAAYRRTTYLGTPDQPGARVKLMASWGRYCLGLATGTDKAAPSA